MGPFTTFYFILFLIYRNGGTLAQLKVLVGAHDLLTFNFFIFLFLCVFYYYYYFVIIQSDGHFIHPLNRDGQQLKEKKLPQNSSRHQAGRTFHPSP
jgi:hypothetical protein